MHDYLREIYFDFCLKNDMPKHNDAYLSAEDYLNGNFQLINSQIKWLGSYKKRALNWFGKVTIYSGFFLIDISINLVFQTRIPLRPF